MGKINSAIVLFFVALLLYIFSIFSENSNLELFSGPIIIPSIYYYYLVSVKGRVNLLFSISIGSFFIGEILFLISSTDFLIPGLICFVIPYFIVVYFIGQDFLYYLKKKSYTLNNISFYIVLLLLFYLLYNGLSFIYEPSQLVFSIYFVYGLLLFVMGILAFLIQLNFNNRTILFMVLMVATFIVSDLFYVFSARMKDVIALKLINVLSQQISYFLYVCYFIYRTRYEIFKKIKY